MEAGTGSCQRIVPRFHLYVRGVLGLMTLLVGIYGYRGSQAKKLAFPLGEIGGRDFREVLRAAEDVESHNNLYVYALEFAESVDFRTFVTYQIGSYPYPPLLALLARPFLSFEIEGAIILWTGLNHGLLLISALLLSLAFKGTSKLEVYDLISRSILFFLLFFFYRPVQLVLQIGQVDIVILCFLSLAFLLHRRGYDAAAGIPLALVISIKPMLGFILVFLAWERRWKTLVVSVGLAAVLAVWGFEVVGWQYLGDYLQVNRTWASGAFLAFPVNQSPTGLVTRAFTANTYCQPIAVIPGLAKLIPIVAGMIALGLWLLAMLLSSEKHCPAPGLKFGLTMTTMMLISPLTEDNHFVWALIPIAALLSAVSDELCSLGDFLVLTLIFVLALYLGYPAISDKIYAGHEALLYQGELVPSSNVWFSGAYLYGLSLLHMCLAGCLLLHNAACARKSAD